MKSFEQFTNSDIDPYGEEDWDDGNIIGDLHDEQRRVKILKDVDVEIIYKEYDIDEETSEEISRDTLNLKTGDRLNCDIISYRGKNWDLLVMIFIDGNVGELVLTGGTYKVL